MKLTADDFKKSYKLPKDYAIEGMLAVGTWPALGHYNLKHIISVLDELKLEYSYKPFDDPDLEGVYELTINNKKYWYFAVMGAAVMHLHLHKGCLFGSKKNILVGTVGGLDPDGVPGEIIIPTETHGNDNTTYYDRSNKGGIYSPDEKLISSLLKRLPEDHPVTRGKTITCEMLLAETKEDIEGWSKDGFLGVEMEAALVFAISKHFNIPGVALLSIGDNAVKDVGFHDKEFEETFELRRMVRRTLIKAAIEELLD